MNKITLALASLLIASAASAQSLESVVFSARNFEALTEAAIKPFQPVDPFAEVGACGILDIKTFRPVALEEAQDMVAPCVAAVGARYHSTFTASAGFLRAPQSGQPAKSGLLIKTNLPAGSPAQRDLEFALARREHMLLGHEVRVLSLGETEPSAISQVQSALEECMLPTVVRDIRTGDDFIKIYGKCLTRDASLKIKEIRAGDGLTVTILSERENGEIEALNGFVTVNAGKGPVKVMVVAYSTQSNLPY